MNKKKNESVFWWAIKNAIKPSLTLGAIMAVICLIACRDDPLKENIYRIIGVIGSTFLFMTIPIIIPYILVLPSKIIQLIKKK